MIRKLLIGIVLTVIIMTAILSPVLAQAAQGQGGYPGPATNTPLPPWTPTVTKTFTPGPATNTPLPPYTPTPTKTATVNPMPTSTPIPGVWGIRVRMPIIMKNKAP